MPILGEKISGIKAGYKNSKHRYIWSACLDCGKERWVSLEKGKPSRLRCCNCANERKKGKDSPIWKGGKFKWNDGYIHIYQGKGKYAGEHRLVIEKCLGRKLKSWEIIHHANGIKDDNRIENLILLSDTKHGEVIKKLLKRIEKLEKENYKLKGGVNNG